MAIIDNEQYSLSGGQVKDIANRITANHDAIGDIGGELASKQDALSQTQLAAVNSGIDSGKVGQIATNTSDIDTIEGKIPAQATAQNQLADKDFVNSSIATNTANFIGTFNSLAELEAYSETVTNNDYAFVVVTDAQGNTAYDRYKYNGGTSTWLFEYELNNSSFTANQWAAINSGITSGDVTKLSGIEAGAEVNDINSISVNGVAQTPDENKNVNLTIDGGVKTLTTADYNYPTNNPTQIALWLLDNGVYIVSANLNVATSTSNLNVELLAGAVIIKSGYTITVHQKGTFGNDSAYDIGYWLTSDSTGAPVSPGLNVGTIDNSIITGYRVADSLTISSSKKRVLDAHQGKVLNERIGDLTTLTTTAKTSAVAAINELDSEIPVITMSSTDPGEGATLAANNFIAYYE